MSADIINLRQARKARARADKEAQAAENRTRFGRTKAERARDVATRGLAEKTLDGHLRAGGSPSADPQEGDASDPDSQPQR